MSRCRICMSPADPGQLCPECQERMEHRLNPMEQGRAHREELVGLNGLEKVIQEDNKKFKIQAQKRASAKAQEKGEGE